MADLRHRQIQREVDDFFANLDDKWMEVAEGNSRPTRKIPYQIHPYLWEGAETMEQQLARQSSSEQPQEEASITQQLAAMEASDTVDSNATTVVNETTNVAEDTDSEVELMADSRYEDGDTTMELSSNTAESEDDDTGDFTPWHSTPKRPNSNEESDS